MPAVEDLPLGKLVFAQVLLGGRPGRIEAVGPDADAALGVGKLNEAPASLPAAHHGLPHIEAGDHQIDGLARDDPALAGRVLHTYSVKTPAPAGK